MIGDSYHPKVLLGVYDPEIPSAGGRKLSHLFGWNDVDRLVQAFIDDLNEVSHGICNYQISERIDLNIFPVKDDGFQYSADGFVRSWQSREGFHTPDWADYDQLINDVGAAEKIRSGQADEVWLFGFPYGGFYESRMAGPDAFWCNAPPLTGHDELNRRFVVIGFNYERGVGEMLESYGHRAESILKHVFRKRRSEANLWQRFTRINASHPGQAEVGTIHFAPNSLRDYEWGSRQKVPSRCDSWDDFPILEGPPRMVDCGEWGNGDTRKHHQWWFNHLPHGAGTHDGLSQNWWEYVIDPNRVK